MPVLGSCWSWSAGGSVTQPRSRRTGPRRPRPRAALAWGLRRPKRPQSDSRPRRVTGDARLLMTSLEPRDEPLEIPMANRIVERIATFQEAPAAARGPFRLSTANRRWSELRSWRTSSCQSRAFVRRACPTPARAWTSATTPRGLPAPGALPHGPGGAERPAAAEHEERSLQKALELAMKAKRRHEGDCGQM